MKNYQKLFDSLIFDPSKINHIGCCIIRTYAGAEVQEKQNFKLLRAYCDLK